MNTLSMIIVEMNGVSRKTSLNPSNNNNALFQFKYLVESPGITFKNVAGNLT